jgi:hypothetical protein
MEYSGYIPTSNLDIAGLTSRLGKSIYGIEVSKQEKRAKLDKIKTDAEDVINSQEMTDSQDFNEFIIKGADNGRSALMTLNKQLKAGEIRPSEYRTAVSKIQKNWGILANSAKTFDDQFKSYAKRQEPGANGFPEASKFEMKLAETFGKVAELKNKDIKFNSKGDLYTIDNETGETWSMDVINRPENIYQNRYDMPGSVADITKGFEAWTGWQDLGKGGEKSIEGFLQNPASKVAIQTGVNAMVSSPRNAISILTDWGNVEASYYMNENEYNQMYSEAAGKLMQAKKQAGLPTELTKEERDNIEMSLVKIEKQGAIINPVLNEKQMEKAKQISENFIKSNVYEKVTGSPKQDWSKPASFYGDGGGNGGTTDGATPMYEKLHNAWFSGNTGLGTLAALSGGRYKFKWNTKGGMDVYEQKPVINAAGEQAEDENGKPKFITELVSLEPIEELEDLAPFFYGQSGAKGSEESLVQFRKERNIYRAKNPNDNKKTPKTKATISQADFNAKWSKLKKGEKLTGPDGKVYTKG